MNHQIEYCGRVRLYGEKLKFLGRGEFEITDVNNEYIGQGAMGYSMLDGCLSRCGNVWEIVKGGVFH